MKTKEYLSNEETKSLRKNSNEMERSILPDKKFKETVIRMLIKLKSRGTQGELPTKRKYAEECNH